MLNSLFDQYQNFDFSSAIQRSNNKDVKRIKIYDNSKYFSLKQNIQTPYFSLKSKQPYSKSLKQYLNLIKMTYQNHKFGYKLIQIKKLQQESFKHQLLYKHKNKLANNKLSLSYINQEEEQIQLEARLLFKNLDQYYKKQFNKNWLLDMKTQIGSNFLINASQNQLTKPSIKKLNTYIQFHFTKQSFLLGLLLLINQKLFSFKDNNNKFNQELLVIAYKYLFQPNSRLNIQMQLDTINKQSAFIQQIYEWDLNTDIQLKNYINSEYQVGTSISYKMNENIKIFNCAQININKFFNSGEDYTIGYGVQIEI